MNEHAPEGVKHADNKTAAKTDEKAEAASAQAGPAAGAETGKQVAVYSYAEDEGLGFEGTTKADYIVPMLDILQSKSPEVENGTIEGAKAGMFIIRALGLIFPGDTGIPFIACGRQHTMNEWKNRDTGGGFVHSHDPNEPDLKKLKEKQPFGKILLGPMESKPNEIVETFTLYGMIPIDEHTVYRVSAPFVSTKIQAYRSFMTKTDGLMALNPNGTRSRMPMFAHWFVLKTVKKTKGKDTWFKYADIMFKEKTAVESRVDPTSTLYEDARNFAKQIKEGLVKADTSAPATDDGGEGGEGQGGGGPQEGQTSDGKATIPF